MGAPPTEIYKFEQEEFEQGNDMIFKVKIMIQHKAHCWRIYSHYCWFIRQSVCLLGHYRVLDYHVLPTRFGFMTQKCECYHA